MKYLRLFTLVLVVLLLYSCINNSTPKGEELIDNSKILGSWSIESPFEIVKKIEGKIVKINFKKYNVKFRDDFKAEADAVIDIGTGDWPINYEEDYSIKENKIHCPEGYFILKDSKLHYSPNDLETAGSGYEKMILVKIKDNVEN